MKSLKKNKKENASVRPALSKETKRKYLRLGGYSVGVTAIVTAIVVILNLIIGTLPSHLTQLDVSSEKIYDISTTSRELLADLQEDITFTVLAVKSDTDKRITNFLDKYTGLSSHIEVTWIDPVLHPSALTEYEASENTIVVACEATGKTTTVDFNNILVVDEYSYYYYGTTDPTAFDGEGQLTSAVSYVTSENQHKIYIAQGHGEEELSTTVSDLMTKSTYEVESLNTLTASIPEDCELLIYNGIAADLTDGEAEELTAYLEGGGHIMVLLGDVEGVTLPNLEEVLAGYGISILDGYVADTASCYQQNPYYIFPTLSLTDSLSANMTSQMLLLTEGHAIALADEVTGESTEEASSEETSTETASDLENVTATAFMTTTDSGYLVTDETQTQGTYTLGATAVKTIEVEAETEAEDEEAADTAAEAEESTDDSSAADVSSDADESTEASSAASSAESSSTEEAAETIESRVTVFGSASIISATITDAFPSLENTTLFMNVTAENFEDVENIAIAEKSLSIEQNTVQHAGLFSLLVIFGIPLIVLVAGFITWLKRRKK